MANSYPIAPWIQPPPNLGQEYLSGLQIGAHISQQQAQLQQDAQMQALKNTLAQQQLQRESQIQMQRLAVEKSYKDQQTQLDMQKLQQDAQQNQIKTQDAARQFQMQQLYTQRVTTGGEDPNKVLSEIGFQMGAPGGAMSEALKARGPQVPKSLSPLGKLQSDRAEAQRRGDSEAVKQFDAAIQEQVSNKGKSIYMGQDDQGRPIFQMTEGGAKPITVGTQTFAQERNIQYENAIGVLSWLQQNIKPEHVGLAGKGGEFVIDRTLSQFLPGVGDKKRMDVRSTLDMAQGLARTLVDSPNERFNVQERNAVLGALPSTGVFESYDRAQEALQRAREVLQNRARVNSATMKQAPPLYALSPQELKARWKAAQTPEEKATIEDALKQFYGFK